MLKIGLVGYGFMGNMHAQCYHALQGDAAVTALVEIDPERCEQARAEWGCETYTDLEEMLTSTDVDVVDICAATYLHESCILTAAAHGKDIICEKPLSLTTESCDVILEAVKQAGVKLMVAHVTRFWPEYQLIKLLVASGHYGQAQSASARRLSAVPAWTWQGWTLDPAKSGGAVLDLMIHDIDFIAWLFGAPTTICAQAIQNEHGAMGSIQSLSWGHPAGATSCIESSLSLPADYPFTMALQVMCEKATITFDNRLCPSLMVYPVNGEPFAPTLPAPNLSAAGNAGGNISDLGGYFNEIKYFVDCVKSGVEPMIITAQDAREAVRLCLAVKESATTGKIVAYSN